MCKINAVIVSRKELIENTSSSKVYLTCESASKNQCLDLKARLTHERTTSFEAKTRR